jgi:DNA-binding CsgD family transcriptional regulator
VTKLLERDREVERIHAVVAEVGAGGGRAIALEAGAGLGKTRLLQESRGIGGDAGLNVLSARTTELERDFPFALARQLFESELTALPPKERREMLEGAAAAKAALGLEPAGGETDDPFAVLHGLYWVTAALAERQPLMLAIDDVHWADPGSLDYLGFLLPRLEELPLLLVMTARPDEPDPPPNLGRVLLDPLVQHLSPTPLSSEATTALLAGELDRQLDSTFAATCHEVSGGNPFLLCELARNLVSQGIEPSAEQAELVRKQAPERVGQTILARLARLSPRAGKVVRSLAVLGDGSDLSLLSGMDGGDPEETSEAIDELRASSILDGDVSPRFIHPLVRNAIYADIPVGERSRSHARAATLLRDRRASPERIGTQLVATEARGVQATVETLVEAGNQALASGAPRSAIAYLTRALEEPPSLERRAAVLDPLLTASVRAADQATFTAAEGDVLDEWARDPTVRSRWGIQVTMLMALGGRFEEAASMLHEAVEISLAEDDLERAYQLQAQLSTLAAVAPSIPEVTIPDYGDQIDPDSPTGRLVAAMELRRAATHGTAAEVAAAGKRALGNDGSIFAEEPELAAAALTVMALVAIDEMDAASHGAQRALAIAREHGATPGLVRGHFLTGFVAWGYGDLVTAEADIRQAIDLARLAGILPLAVMYTGPLMEVLIERDELDEAEAALQEIGMAEVPLSAQSLLGMVLMIRAHLRFERGELERALVDHEALSTDWVKEKLGHGPAGSASPFAVKGLMALGRKEEARKLADEMIVYARHLGNASSIAHVLRAVAASRGGGEAVVVLEEAVALTRDCPRRLERAHALVDLGEALRRDGRRADARGRLREAFDLARRCGAARIAKRANAELEATGVKARRYAPIGVESLTPSERRVADLAASGMTNRQIAQSLFVTVKTVEAHLSAAYGKLDIGSRRELPAALAGGGPAAS